MANSWSFLYDEIMSTNDIYEDSLPEFLSSTQETSQYGEDLITFDIDFPMKQSYVPELPEMDLITESKGTPWKYNEEEIVKELLEYIRGTYKQHYAANDENIQTLDFIEAAHKDGEAFCRDNILKYTSRYDKKGTADRDIMKIQHYAVLLKFFRNKNNNRETYPQ